jgi:hypothetical protein
LEVGELSLDEFEKRLVEIAESKKSETEIFPHIKDIATPVDDDSILTD